MRQLLIAFVGLILIVPTFAFAQLDPSETGLTTTGEEVYGSGAETDIGVFIGSKIITPALSLVGVIFLVLIIYSGFLWMTAGGNEAQVTKAKNIMIASVTGVIIIVAAYAITNFVFNAIS